MHNGSTTLNLDIGALEESPAFKSNDFLLFDQALVLYNHGTPRRLMLLGIGQYISIVDLCPDQQYHIKRSG